MFTWQMLSKAQVISLSAPTLDNDDDVTDITGVGGAGGVASLETFDLCRPWAELVVEAGDTTQLYREQTTRHL